LAEARKRYGYIKSDENDVKLVRQIRHADNIQTQKLNRVKPSSQHGLLQEGLQSLRSFLFLKDITAILHTLGCSVRNNPLLGPSITPTPFMVGDGGPTEYRVSLTQWENSE
jgi:hypothetical protein